MTDPRILLRLIGESRAYQPGQTLKGEFFVDVPRRADIKAVEVSVLWVTEGKGDEDMAVHYFQRFGGENGSSVDLRRTQIFETDLPQSPLSYDGVLVKIHWCVRLRVFLPQRREVVTEQPFLLGVTARGVHRPVVMPVRDVNVTAEDEANDAPKSTDT